MHTHTQSIHHNIVEIKLSKLAIYDYIIYIYDICAAHIISKVNKITQCA